MAIQLDLTRDLPKVRKAYPRLVKHLGQCSYSAPCAVGAMLTLAQRKTLRLTYEDGTPIDSLINRGTVSVPEGQEQDFLVLQEAFDRGDREEFDGILSTFERRYAEQVPA